LDAKLEIDSLKASPVVSDEVECADCPIFFADLALFKEKHASKCDELDVLMVEVAERKSRSALLGACTSCPVLHGKIDEMHAYIVSLEAKLKEPIPTSCSTCELHVLKNLELAHYVDRLQDENDELRKLMGWLSGHELQLRIIRPAKGADRTIFEFALILKLENGSKRFDPKWQRGNRVTVDSVFWYT
jgi:hypothetical protein